MYASSVISSPNFRKKVRTNKPVLSLGLALPFQPSMQDEKTMERILKEAEQMLCSMLYNALERVDADDMFARLQKIFSGLNYNSHCKSIAVLLTPGDEKVLYLNFPLNPAGYLHGNLSLLQIVVTSVKSLDFYTLVLKRSHAQLFEFRNSQLKQVFATKPVPRLNEKENSGKVFKQVLQTIERMNGNSDKPIFITGSPAQVDQFYNACGSSGIFFRLLDNTAPFDKKMMNRLVNDIYSRWNYWQSKFIIARIGVIKKEGVLIAEIEMVLRALRNGIDGLLLIDQCLAQRLFKSKEAAALLNTADELMNQLERFLTNGNRIEITEAGLLQEFGEIVLLQHKAPHFFTNPPVRIVGKCNKPDTF